MESKQNNTTPETLTLPASEVIKLAQERLQFMPVAGPGFIARPVGVTLEDVQTLLPTTRRTVRKVNVVDVSSFLEYVTRFKKGATVIFEGLSSNSFEAILDYHDPASPAWCEHSCVLGLQYDPQFAEWINRDRKPVTQVEFADWLELNNSGISKPSAADVLEMARTLQATRRANFRSGVRTQNGDVQFQYDRETTATAGQRGQLDIPEWLELLVPVFRGQNPVDLKVRLQYRISESGQLSFTTCIYNKLQVLEAAKQHVRAQVAGLGLPVYQQM